MAKPGIKSQTSMAPEFTSRKAQIATLVGTGAKLPAIWRAMEGHYPQTIKDDAIRAELCSELEIPFMPYDPVERDNLGKAIRQVKGLMIKEDAELSAVIDEVGGGEIEKADDIELTNRKRFDCGIAGINYLYGQTAYIWLEDDSEGEFKTLTVTKRINGEDVEKEVRVMVEGRYKRGDLMHKDMGKNGNWVAESEKDAYIEHGMPESFLSIWGGAPGVGKTRLAIALSKALNRMGHGVLYYNGEADKKDFRGWLGSDVDEDLLSVVSGEMIRTEKAVEQIYTVKPKVVIFDSAQMLAEIKKGKSGEIRVMSVMKQLKADPEAGNPHIVFISQLNKKDELAGSRNLEHMVDFAALATKIEGCTGEFMLDCPRKNRGGPTPRKLRFKHTGGTVLCSSTGLTDGPVYKFMQTTNNPIIINGATPPAM